MYKGIRQILNVYMKHVTSIGKCYYGIHFKGKTGYYMYY